ncbi:MAG: FAD-dependent oxidoreductase, partial [Prevotella sp.]|nr:FAD-dependent oxidoreductase [Prevotella sp.]
MTDLIIIGCGPGGYQTAHHAARKGLQVTIFEDQEVGGTCLNRGCIPTKTFCHVADVIDGVHDAEAYGIDNLGFDINFAKIRDHKNEVVSQLRSGIETLMSAPGITLVKGKASMKDAHTVICNGEEYQARNIIIATGSHAKMPPIEGIHSPNVVTSTELLDIDHIPAHLVIVGAGVIGMEFAAAFSSFGSSVTVIEFLKECLPPVDSDIAKRLRKLLEKRGIKFFLQAGVKRIEGQTVIFEQKGKELRVDGDTILIATGRGANTDGLNLDEVGIQYDRRGICTDEHLETSVKGVYAIGDVNGKMMLAHAAEFQGYHVINHLLGEEDAIR